MNDNLKEKVAKAKELHGLALAKSESGDFAYKLAARSFESHIDELSKSGGQATPFLFNDSQS